MINRNGREFNISDSQICLKEGPEGYSIKITGDSSYSIATGCIDMPEITGYYKIYGGHGSDYHPVLRSEIYVNRSGETEIVVSRDKYVVQCNSPFVIPFAIRNIGTNQIIPEISVKMISKNSEVSYIPRRKEGIPALIYNNQKILSGDYLPALIYIQGDEFNLSICESHALRCRYIEVVCQVDNATDPDLELMSDDVIYAPDGNAVIDLGVTNHRKWRGLVKICLLYTSPSPRDLSTSRMPSSA